MLTKIVAGVLILGTVMLVALALRRRIDRYH